MPEVQSLPILDSLSTATSKIFHPLHLQDGECIILDLTEDAKHFLAELVHLVLPYDSQRNRPGYDPLVYKGTEHVRTTYGLSYNTKRDFLDRLPELRSIDGWSTYHFAATDFTALVIKHSWPEDRIIFKSSDAKTLYYFLLRRFLAQSMRANMAAKFKINKELPQIPSDYRDGRVPLSDYQKVAMMFALGQEASALFMDKGTGKTAVSISRLCMEAARKWKKEQKMLRAVIVCPNQVRTNWQNEFERFASVPGKTVIVRGGKFKRMKLFAEGIRSDSECIFSAFIVGYDTFVCDTEEMWKKVPWDLVICDESHYFKSDRTERYKAMKEIREISKKRMILTGTPIANTIFDLYSQFEFLGEGLSGFSSMKNFRHFHGKFVNIGDPNSNGSIQKLVGLRNIPLLQERLSRLSFSITKAEAGLNLPDKVYDIHEVQMTKPQRELYERVASQLAVELKEILEEGAEIEQNRALVINHVLTSLLRLAQVTSGHVKWGAEYDKQGVEITPAVVQQIPGGNPKIDAVIDLLTEEDRDPLGKTVIWCCFVEDIKAISKRLTEAGIKHGTYYGAVSQSDREKALQSFNGDPDYKVLVCNPATAGEGLNLVGYDPHNPNACQTYCDHEIFFSQNWSAIERSQAEDRAHRRGTRCNVRITDLVVPGTIDEEIRARVLDKLNTANKIQDIREILKSVLSLHIEEDD